jgi:IMP dehydrogenase
MRDASGVRTVETPPASTKDNAVVEISDALSYDDVLLLPGPSSVLPRDVSIQTTLAPGLTLRTPILSAAMDKVTEADMAVAMARQGGLGVIHKNGTVEDQAAMVEGVKRSESGFISDPITLTADDPVQRSFDLMARYKVSGFPVVDGERKLVGIVTNRDLRNDADPTKPVRDYMTSQGLVTAAPGTTLDQARVAMQDARVEKLPIVDADGRLTGMFTFKDIEKVRRYPSSAKDDSGRLLVAAAIGVGGDGDERAEALVRAQDQGPVPGHPVDGRQRGHRRRGQGLCGSWGGCREGRGRSRVDLHHPHRHWHRGAPVHRRGRRRRGRS